MTSARGLEREIEWEMGRRMGRECIFLPSGRVALYCALRLLTSPGDRVLMSPVNDDVVLFTVLAAGVRPVMAPVSADNGNMDIAGVPEATWHQVRAVISTNLYGVPDQVNTIRTRCTALGIPFVEDVAHGIETVVDGKPLGAFGEMAIFSLSKHIEGGWGGILALGNGDPRADVERLRGQIEVPRGRARLAFDYLWPRMLAASRRTGVAALLRRAGVVDLVLPSERGSLHRMPLHPAALRKAMVDGPGLEPFDGWVRVDGHDYRRPAGADSLRRTLAGIRGLAADREARMEAVDRLRRRIDSVAPIIRQGDPLPLFRVPLLVARRAVARSELRRRGCVADYIYDPPLDTYAGREFVDASPDHAGARWWASHVLPLNPRRVEAVLRAFRDWAPDPADLAR